MVRAMVAPPALSEVLPAGRIAHHQHRDPAPALRRDPRCDRLRASEDDNRAPLRLAGE